MKPLQLLAITLSLLLVACGEKTATQPNPSRDNTPRLAVLSPALGLILIDLGLQDRVVARHAWDQFLPKSLPAAGDQAAIDYEALITANPTHVLIEWGQRDLPAKLDTLAADSGWTVTDHTLLTLDDIIQTTRNLADRFEVFTSLPDTLEQAWTQQPPTNAGTVLLLIQTTPEFAALGPTSAHHQILTRLGHAPALPVGSPYQTLSAEDLITLDPDHIVLIAPGADAPNLEPLNALNLQAQLHTLTGPADLVPSTRLLSFTARLRNTLADSNKPETD